MTPNHERPAPRFDWFIPIDGDGEHIGTLRAERPPTYEYLSQVVEAAEENDFYSMLIPTRFANGLFDQGAPLAETWTMVTALAAQSRKIRFLIAVRPGFVNPGLFAQMAATLSQITGGRVDLNVVPGGIKGEFEKMGERIDHDTRYERAEEFIAAIRKLWEKPEPVSFEGKIRHIKRRALLARPGGRDAQVLPGRRIPSRPETRRNAVGRLSRLDRAGGGDSKAFRTRAGFFRRGGAYTRLRGAFPSGDARHRGGSLGGDA